MGNEKTCKGTCFCGASGNGSHANACSITAEKSFDRIRRPPGTAVIRVVYNRSRYVSHGISTQLVVATIGPENCVNSKCWFCQAVP